jgi:hypothetical protein
MHSASTAMQDKLPLALVIRESGIDFESSWRMFCNRRAGPQRSNKIGHTRIRVFG